mmetsp:Transcript_20489/g.50925  ORF Transcript_20489/g.50925 Transcript_20489/m.50925 type:complete len:204 (+) Transcript_20489:2059-2670(+)
MAERRHLHGELALGQGLVHVYTAQQNLRRARQTQVAVLDGVHLRVFGARLETALLHCTLPHKVRNHHGLKPLRYHFGQCPVDERQLQQRSHPSQIHKAAAAHLTACLEVEHSQALADVHVACHLEAEVALGANLAFEHRHFLAAEGYLGVRVVGNLLALALQLRLQRVEVALHRRQLVLQRLSLLYQRRPRLGLQLALHAFGV